MMHHASANKGKFLFKIFSFIALMRDRGRWRKSPEEGDPDIEVMTEAGVVMAMTMALRGHGEVEVKARVQSVAEAEGMVIGAGGVFVKEALQQDTYMKHPCWDLNGRDEALRLRNEGGICAITFKGKRQGGPAKVREEVEATIEGFEEARAIFERLGFTAAITLAKRRRTYRVGAATVVIDSVEGLGTFMEVEVKAGPGAAAFESAKNELFRTIDMLGISRESIITDSYLELLASESSDSRADR
jgi:adenylate cyclase class 2